MSADSVIQALMTAVAAAPDDIDLRLHLTEQLVDADRAAEAVDHVLAALALAPDSVPALGLAADVHEAIGDESKARQYRVVRDALAASGASPDRPEPSVPDEADHVASDDDPGARRRAVPADGDDARIPDTADELFDAWAKSEPLEEVEFGHLTVAGASLDDVGGLERVKAQLHRSFLAPMRNPEMAATFGKAASGGLLLWGPPGCGKTFLARATAGEMGANFYNVALSDVLEMWIGASERNLASIFDAARRNSPCVVFFDEVDALGQRRGNLRQSGSALRGVVSQFLAELDGLGDSNDGVFVLAATNHPWDVDEALLRPGRFDRQLLVLPPDEPARDAILRYHLRGRPTDELDLGPIVAATEGYSGADLAYIVEVAAESALDASLASGDVEPISKANIAQAKSTVEPSIGTWLEFARNHVMYANREGKYDELEAYIREYDKRSRKRGGR